MRTFNHHRLVWPLLIALVTVGCAGDLSRREAATRKSYVDYAGEPIKEFFAWRIDGWTPVSDRKSTRLNSSHSQQSRMPSSA